MSPLAFDPILERDGGRRSDNATHVAETSDGTGFALPHIVQRPIAAFENESGASKDAGATAHSIRNLYIAWIKLRSRTSGPGRSSPR